MVARESTRPRRRLPPRAAAPPAPSPDGGRISDLAELRPAIQDCRRCSLWRDASQGGPGEGPASAPLMLVGEQPGDKEDLEGHPFVGPAGQLLSRALEAAGIARDEAYVTNAVKLPQARASRCAPTPAQDAGCRRCAGMPVVARSGTGAAEAQADRRLGRHSGPRGVRQGDADHEAAQGGRFPSKVVVAA